MYLVFDAGLDVGLEDVGDALRCLDGHRAFLDHDLRVLGHLSDPSRCGLYVLQICCSALKTKAKVENEIKPFLVKTFFFHEWFHGR